MCRPWSGPTAAALLFVLVAAPPCAAGQQLPAGEEAADASLSDTLDQLWTFVRGAVESAATPLRSELEATLADLRADLATRDRQLADRQDDLDSRLEQLQTRLADKLDGGQSALATQVTELGARLEDGQRQVADKISQSDRADRYTSLVAEKAELSARNTELAARNAELLARNTELSAQNTESAARITELVSQSSELAAQNTELLARNTELSAQNTELAAQNTELSAQNSELQSRLEAQESQQVSAGPVLDCSDLPPGTDSGVHVLERPDTNSSVSAYCDLATEGGGWTVIQRRADIQPRLSFQRGWQAYKDGFGQLEEEFWWGLEHIWRTTSTLRRRYTLRVNLEDFEGEKRYAQYQNFSISPESDGYRLSLSSYQAGSDAGDSLMKRHLNMRFSTNDNDQDLSTSNCAHLFGGGWWYQSCFDSNLNGRYQSSGPSDYGAGIHWRYWKGFKYSLKAVEMKIRPITTA